MKKKIITKAFFILIILASLLVGIIFSGIEIANNAKLDSTFVGKYVATVKVEKNKEDDTSKEDYAKESAQILEDRLNPMGINDISVEIAGYDYLKVHGSRSTFMDQDLFKSEIQKTGSIFLMNQNNGELSDVSLTKTPGGENGRLEKKTLNDFITKAKASTHSIGGTKNPVIEFEINSTNFESLFPTSETEGEELPLSLQMFSDPDSFFESVRSMFKTIDESNSRLRIKKYFDRVISPIRKLIADEPSDSVVVLAMEDLFSGSYIDINGYKQEVNLISTNSSDKVSYEKFHELMYSTWKFTNNTTKYVYNSNAAADEFTEGAYKEKLLSSSTEKPIGYIEDVFQKLMDTLLIKWYSKEKPLLEDEFISRVNNQFIFNGSIYKGEQSNAMPSGTGFIDNTTMKLFVDSFAKSRIGETIFNASSKGYIFNVDTVETVEPLINNTLFIVMSIAILILMVLFMLFMLFSYRILGMFVLVVTLAIMFATLAIATSWLGLTFGIETLLAMFIIFVINCQLSITIVDAMKKSVYKLKRDFKSSLTLSIKENTGVVVDILVALLIPSFCLFWLSSAALKTFSILITFGVAFSLVGQLIVLLILFRLVVGTKLFSKFPFLFAINISGESHIEMIRLYRVESTRKAITKAEAKNKINKLELLKTKLAKQEENLEKYYSKQREKLSLRETKYISLLNKQKKSYEVKLAKIKNEKKRLNWELRIVDIERTLEQMGVVADSSSNVVVETFDRYELSKFKANSSLISKVLLAFFILLSTLSVGLGFGIGVNYDSTMGGRVEYTVYGANVDSDGRAAIGEIALHESASSDLKQFASDIIFEWDANKENAPRLYAEFIEVAFSRYSDEMIGLSGVNRNTSFGGVNFETSYGNNFQYNSGSVEEQSWVQIKAKNISSKQSNKFKKVLFGLNLVEESNENDENFGFISKRIFPKTTTTTIVTTAIAFGVSLLVLGIYILIRYGWTYFIALAMGSVLTIGLIIVVVIGGHLSFGSTMVVSMWTLFMLFISFSLIYFGKIKEKISSKDSKSMNEFFNTEIDVLIELRSFRKELRREVLTLKSERRIELKERKLKLKTTKSKERKLNLNKEELKANILAWNKESKDANKITKDIFKEKIKELKTSKKLEYRTLKKEGNEKIVVASKENNYVLSIVLSVFKENLNKFIFVLGCYAITFIIFMIFIPTIFSMGMTLLVGSIIGWIIISFICLPMWLTIEQRRLRKNLTRKKFISELKVSNEEQIIESIND
ncbi:protein translocase SecDF, variant type [Spiroplasma endosymbiont of Othius punctulatus]|uniref:protein translocase SecDF, variant type n=1 Tax=Spiroplasma endosymbiont of Othius punctulatus TaxID=3066289 RepID=UPI0030D3DD58